ncbi:acetyl-CoA C-acetyltransferase [Frisingicoccus sp.]|uniref:acetyl-CoA C-acetyltransferase n=1 Tax=Frisingicoccus sp. TaxID=1918627 RepID=UPI0015BCC95B|nr:acetyl-CoA C-acetyltransferase [Frisingicoccus sp.]MEE0752992.1 acetyl-CoA C-acetyltransferase [Frisingicoccus sp.]
MKDVVIVSAARTPFGKFGGAFKSLKATDLGGMAIREALKRAGIQGGEVDEVIYGMVVPAGQGQIPGRQASVKGGIPHEVPVVTINKVCGSALKAVTLGTQIIKAGDADIIVAGGMESMSNIPYVLENMRWGARMNDVKAKDAMVLDGLWCPENDVHMAVIGGAVASEYGVTREMQDEWSVRSQKLWAEGENQGKFDDELFAVEVPGKKGAVTTVTKDEAPRPETTMEGLSKLPPLFVKDGTVTAGNAPGTNDGASAIVLMSREKAEELGAPILAVIKGYAQASRESRYIATVPGLAIRNLMEKNDLTVDDFDLMEINEAFAAVPLVSCLGILGMTPESMDAKVNVNGGAVAVGHPIGATGARILMTLIYELRRSGKKSGVAAICSGMAQGDAVWVEVE